MNDEKTNPPAPEERPQALQVFLEHAVSDLARVRERLPDLLHGDMAPWRKVDTYARQLVHRAMALELRVLAACAREMLQLTQARLRGNAPEPQFQLLIESAVEVVELELRRLGARFP